MGRMVGYARVSTSDQDMSLQWEALRRAGCQESLIFCDTASGARTARPGLEACLQMSLNLSQFVARQIWRKRGMFPLRCRAHRLQRRGPL